MKRLLIAFAAVALGLGLAACNQKDNSGSMAGADSADQGPVIAKVNGKPVTEAVFKTYLDRRTGGGKVDLNDDQRKELVDQVVNIELLAQHAEDQGLDKKSDTATELEIQRSQLLANAAIQNYLDQNPITDQDIKDAYNKRVEEMPKKEYKARHILVKTKAEAEDIIKQLNNGGDFKKLAAKSIEPGAEKRGGELGWFSPDQMVEPFANAVEGMDKGSYTKEPVKTQYGWHVIQLEDVRKSPTPTLDDLKPQLKSMLQRQKIQGYINDLRGKAQIEEMPAKAESKADDEKAADKADNDADEGMDTDDNDGDDTPKQ